MIFAQNGGGDKDAPDSGAVSLPVMPSSPAKALEPKPAPLPGHGDGNGNGYMMMRARPHRTTSFLNMLAALSLLALLGLGATLYFGKTRFEDEGPLTAKAELTVRPGMNLRQIASALEQKKIITNRWIFQGGVMLHGQTANLKAGEYSFAPGSSMQSVMDILAGGKSILRKITVPEGLTSGQIVERLKSDPVLTGEITDIPAEGSLLPETYSFNRDQTRAGIIANMQKAQGELLDKLWPGRDQSLPFSTRKEALILASIVEKETGISSERARIAGVFVNRLKNNIRLQSDPTIIYGLVGGKGKLGHPLKLSELKKPTPYNTYQIDGLPPTPIANPGRAAIAAVLNPEKNNYLYFVADGTGGHVFSKTLVEHRQNVSRWRKIELKNRQKPGKTTVKAKPSPPPPTTAPAPQAMPEAKTPPVTIPESKSQSGSVIIESKPLPMPTQ